MADYSLSVEADRDLFEIASYTLQTWGEQQAGLYLRRLHKLLERLAENPRLGTGCDDIRSGYFRRLHGSHMIFYKRSPEGAPLFAFCTREWTISSSSECWTTVNDNRR